MFRRKKGVEHKAVCVTCKLIFEDSIDAIMHQKEEKHMPVMYEVRNKS
jgi:hypothetical protein